MVGGVVGGMFGGPMGAQLGSQIGGGIGGMLEGLISQHGQSNVQSAMNNNMMGSLVGQLSQAIQSHPGIPQFARDEMCQALGDVQQRCPAEPTPPDCQQDTDNMMNEIIDKVVEKVVDRIMEKLQGGGECESGGSIEDMVSDALKEVVSEMIGGSGDSGGGADADAGGCAANGGTNSSGGANESSWKDAFKTQIKNEATEASEEAAKGKNKCGGGKGGNNWLSLLAGSFAEMQSKHLDKALTAQETMQNSGDDQKEFMKANQEFQVQMQMFKMVSESAANALKSIGEALNSMARKQ